MANEIVTKITSDVSEFNQGMESATGKVEGLQDSVDSAKKSIKDLGDKGSLSTKQLLAEIGKFTNSEKNLSNYRRQLSQMTKDIQDLTINYNSMTKEMKNSDIGQATLQRIQELTTKAGEYKDAIMDSQQAIAALASDTQAWDAVKMGIDTASAALQGFVSMGVLGEQSTEALVGVIAKLKAVEAATNAVIKVGTSLQKQSALMMGISKVQALALAKAKNLEAAATGKATAAQKLFNLIASANPYVLLATAIIAVGSALAAFAIHSNKAKKAEEEAQKAHESYMESMEDSISKMGEAAYSFDTLKKRYEECRTEAEKQQFLKDYKSKLDDLGISVNSINGLENVFINRTEDFRKACILRAQAMGLETMQADSYKQMMSEVMKARDLAADVGPNSRVNEKTPLFDMLKEYGVYDTYVARWGKDYVVTTNDVMDDLEKAIRERFKKTSQDIADEQKALEDQVSELNLGDAFNFNGKGNSGTTTTTTTSGGSGTKRQADIKNEINLLEEEKKKLQEQIPTVEHLSDRHKEILARIQEIDAEVNKLKDDEANWLKSLSRQPIELLPVVSPINMPTQVTGPTPRLAGSRPKTNDDKVDIYKQAQDTASKIQEWLDLGLIGREEAKAFLENINKSLQDEGIKASVSIEIDEDSLSESIGSIREKFDTLQGIVDSPVQAINSVVSSFKSMNDAIQDPDATGWEQFFAVFQAGMSVLDAVSTVMGVLQVVTDLLSASKDKNTQASLKEAGAEAAAATAKGASVGPTIAAAGAEGALASSKGASSVASVPIAGPVLAIAAIASIMAAIVAMIASAKGFATGGVIGGSSAYSTTGDKILARLNAGELVLNQRQQNTLWKDMNRSVNVGDDYRSSISIPDKITVTAHGRDLQATLTNINKFNSNI